MKLRDYNDKPKARFLGKGEWHIGVELEMEAPDDDAWHKGLELRQNPQFCYAKPDGSLEQGWELITQPIPMEQWLAPTPKGALKDFFKLVRQLSQLGYRSHNTETCGLHVHICRKALGKEMIFREGESSHDKTPTTYYWFRRLIHGALFTHISQRSGYELERWASQLPGWYRNPRRPKYNDRRYEAVNLTEKTIEIRIFRGNMREERIRKAVESVIAAVNWAKYASGRSAELYKSKRSDSQLFISYVKRNAKKYPNLWAFIVSSKLENFENERVKPVKRTRSEFMVPDLEPWGGEGEISSITYTQAQAIEGTRVFRPMRFLIDEASTMTEDPYLNNQN
jgi:hypothetical protein